MTRRVPNEWFSLCTTKSPACPTVPHFALSSTYAPLLFFRSLISFVPPVPTLRLPVPRILSFPRYRSTFSCSSLEAKQFIPFLLYFLFHPPDLRFPFPHILISSLSSSFLFLFSPFFFFFLFDRGIKIHDSRDSFNIFNNFVLCLNYYYGSYLTVFANFESRILKS